MTQRFILELENTDIDRELLEELVADALEGEMPLNEKQPIVVSVQEPRFLLRLWRLAVIWREPLT